jgi:hypothetical protein
MPCNLSECPDTARHFIPPHHFSYNDGLQCVRLSPGPWSFDFPLTFNCFTADLVFPRSFKFYAVDPHGLQIKPFPYLSQALFQVNEIFKWHATYSPVCANRHDHIICMILVAFLVNGIGH